MSRISVRGGLTQFGRVLAHAREEARRGRVARWYSSAMRWRRRSIRSFSGAGELALVGVKAFMFQEGDDPAAQRAFKEIARVTGGAYGAFNAGSAARLEALLKAAACYAAGGRAALEAAGARSARGPAVAATDARLRKTR